METLNKINNDDTFRVWQKFITTGILGSNTLNEEICRSWQRCYEMNIDPYDGCAHLVLDVDDFNELIRKRQDLIHVARPLMEKLYKFVAGTGFIVMLTDEKGYIMEFFTDQEALFEASRLGFTQGAYWAEEQVGTNAIGTAIIEKRPLQVSGAQHYCYKQHQWTCSAAPIFNSHEEMIGILNISGPYSESHLHTLGMVVSAAEAIMLQMRLQEKNRELSVINSRMNNVFKTMSDGVIILDKRGIIRQVNPAASKILQMSAREIEGRYVEDIIKTPVRTREMLVTGTDYSDVEVNVETAHGNVGCVASGKPINDEKGKITGAVIIINPAKKIRNLVNKFSGAHATFRFKDIIGKDRYFMQAVQIAMMAADKNSNVLLQGESGTGKELFAQAIHNRSSRRNGPFIAVNCGAIPRELLGSELFGYVEGAFTGAKRGGRPGKFELASGGTLFLDEIGEMPLGKQVSLLRAIQEKEITRVGDDKVIPVDVRIICATNRDLQKEVEKGNFRKDLYYRLNVISITLPPLRERLSDIPMLFKYFIEDVCRKQNLNIPHVDKEVIDYIMQYDWPGNVRELYNAVERMINITNGDPITTQHLPAELLNNKRSHVRLNPDINAETTSVAAERAKKKQIYAEMEYQEITSLLRKHGGNISRVAQEMGVSRNTIYRKLRQYNIGV